MKKIICKKLESFFLDPLMQRINTKYSSFYAVLYVFTVIIVLADYFNTGENSIGQIPQDFMVVSNAGFLIFTTFIAIDERLFTSAYPETGKVVLASVFWFVFYASVEFVFNNLNPNIFQTETLGLWNLFGMVLVIKGISIVFNVIIQIARRLLEKRRGTCKINVQVEISNPD